MIKVSVTCLWDPSRPLLPLHDLPFPAVGQMSSQILCRAGPERRKIITGLFDQSTRGCVWGKTMELADFYMFNNILFLKNQVKLLVEKDSLLCSGQWQWRKSSLSSFYFQWSFRIPRQACNHILTPSNPADSLGESSFFIDLIDTDKVK